MADEIEFKLLVDGPEALEAVARAAAARGARRAAPARQVNHFLDTAAGALRAGDAVVRLREEGSRWVLAAKGAAEQAGELHRRVELELDLSSEVAARVLEGRADPLELLEGGLGTHPLLAGLRSSAGDQPLVHAGCFTNRRTRVGPLQVAGHALHLELDRTEFPGPVEHCEIELEVPAGTEQAAGLLLRELLAEAGVSGTSAPSKAARFFRALAGEPI